MTFITDLPVAPTPPATDSTTMPDLLAHARQHEARTGEMSRMLTRRLAGLHAGIRLPEAGRLEALLHFIEEYVSHVPRLAAALEQAGREARQESLVQPLLQKIRVLFVLSANEGLTVLLDRAYAVQRLVEELNDRFMLMAGAPLLALDMTTANLIVHSLIGEPYANDLDEGATAAASELMEHHIDGNPQRFRASTEQQRLRMWATSWRHWSEELGVNGIDLRLMAEPGP